MKKNAVGRAGNVFFGAEDADIRLDLVVVRRKVVVAAGPIVAEAVACLGFEIDGSKAQSAAPPMIGSAADDAGATPLTIVAGRARIRLALKRPCAIGR